MMTGRQVKGFRNLLCGTFCASHPLHAKLIWEKIESFASDYYCTGTLEEIRRGAAIPGYFIHGFRRRTDRPDRPERIGQIDTARDPLRPRAAGHWRGGGPQTHAPELRHADFGVCP